MTSKMAIAFLLAAALIAAATGKLESENRIALFELECRAELDPRDPCVRACQMEKMGIMRNGVVDFDLALLKMDPTYGLTTYPKGDNFMMLARSIMLCIYEIQSPRNQDKCMQASAMYHCINSRLSPNILYMRGMKNGYSYAGPKPNLPSKFNKTARKGFLQLYDRFRSLEKLPVPPMPHPHPLPPPPSTPSVASLDTPAVQLANPDPNPATPYYPVRYMRYN